MLFLPVVAAIAAAVWADANVFSTSRRAPSAGLRSILEPASTGVAGIRPPWPLAPDADRAGVARDTSFKTGPVERGIASSYGEGFNGRKTASGEIYNQTTYTAAHRKLPFGTRVLVRNLRNGREVTVRINNRGPFVKGRIIDVSLQAAKDLGMIKAGIVPVEVVVLSPPSRDHQAAQ